MGSRSASTGLREKDFGSWEGLTGTEIEQRFPGAVRGRWGDGETTEEVADARSPRSGESASHTPTGRVLVVSHGGPLRAILARLDVEPGPIGNCDVFRIDA